MAINLTTPYNPGDFDPGKIYTDAKIISFQHDWHQKVILATVEFGIIEADGTWTPGKAKLTQVLIKDTAEVLNPDGTVLVPASSDYTLMVTALPLNGETVYQAAARELYSYVSTSSDHSALAGTVV